MKQPEPCKCVVNCLIQTGDYCPACTPPSLSKVILAIKLSRSYRQFVEAGLAEDDADFVFIALDENHYQQRPVEIALRLKDTAVITKGLQPNQKLVTEGALMLRAEEEVETDAANP